jgi:hypothetical protein
MIACAWDILFIFGGFSIFVLALLSPLIIDALKGH